VVEKVFFEPKNNAQLIQRNFFTRDSIDASHQQQCPHQKIVSSGFSSQHDLLHAGFFFRDLAFRPKRAFVEEFWSEIMTMRKPRPISEFYPDLNSLMDIDNEK
jgi:hypothetical protein